MFRQKITDGDRILATILYRRRICGLDALSELFGVCRSTLWNAIRDVLPVLDDRRIDIAPAGHRHPTQPTFSPRSAPITTRLFLDDFT
ncbi:transposase family protein [Streptomyces flavotricini]|uniref:Transposase family protein n=1 Tax=Streptomyces flavotricini TaxID=66888 RepID=A0ABS8DWQ4_9ACTN|nr:transposase family protein [Streptomyces flavotricini]MCC0093237.1 transposase family protein [Streptomyces flavotricini]